MSFNASSKNMYCLKTYRQRKTKYKIYYLVKLNRNIGKSVIYFETVLSSSIVFHAA